MQRRGFLIAGAAAFAGAAFGARAQTPTLPAPAPAVPPAAATPAAATTTLPAPVAPPPELEAIRSAIVGRRGLSIRVVSHGCTRKADFAAYVERKAGVTTVAFGRKRIEMCGRGRAGEMVLDFSFKDLGIDPDEPVVVLNPLLAARAAPAPIRRHRH